MTPTEGLSTEDRKAAREHLLSINGYDALKFSYSVNEIDSAFLAGILHARKDDLYRQGYNAAIRQAAFVGDRDASRIKELEAEVARLKAAPDTTELTREQTWILIETYKRAGWYDDELIIEIDRLKAELEVALQSPSSGNPPDISETDISKEAYSRYTGYDGTAMAIGFREGAHWIQANIKPVRADLAALRTRNSRLVEALKGLYSYTPDLHSSAENFEGDFHKAILKAKSALSNAKQE